MNKELESTIRQEIREWSFEKLEQPNPHYNNFPACPFAAKAWADKKVDISFNYTIGPLSFYKILSNYNDKFELVMLVDFAYQPDPDRFHEYLTSINESIAENCFGDRDLFVMGFHPEDDPNEIIEDNSFETELEDMYAMIFIQRLSLLCHASDKLQRNKYYKRNFGNYEVSNIIENRNNLYRRMLKCPELKKQV